MAQFWSRGALRTLTAGAGFLFFSAMSADAGPRADFSSIETSEIRFLSVAECQADFVAAKVAHRATQPKTASGSSKSALSDFLSWVPDGTSAHPEPDGCEPERIERLFLNSRGATDKQASALRDFFKRCDADLRFDAPVGLHALLNTTETEYAICDHPNMRKVVIRTPSGDIIRGMLALKPGSSSRPLVITKCGVLCNAGDASMRSLLMHLYDEGPFNVLALANNSGADFVRDNGYFAPGGYQEGQQVIEIAQMIRRGALGSRTSSIHFVGISLGSHAGLYASYINQFNPVQTSHGEEPLFTSTLATCPVVDLHESIDNLFSQPIKGSLARVMFESAISKVVTSIPMLGSLFEAWDGLEDAQLPMQIGRQSAEHYRKRRAGWQIAPFQNSEVRTPDDFWKVNQFLELAKQPLKTPTLVLAAEDDQIVETDKNAKMLERAAASVRRRLAETAARLELLAKTSGQPATAALASLPRENLDSVIVPTGNHCAFSQIYGWKTSSALYRSYIISNSPDLVARRHIVRARFPAQLDRDAREDEVLEGTKKYTSAFRFEKDADKIFVTTKYINGSYAGGHGECGSATRTAPDNCFTEVEMEIPFSQLSPRPSWAHAPATQSEAESLTRWANVQMKVLSNKGGLLEETTEDAAQLAWVSYDN